MNDGYGAPNISGILYIPSSHNGVPVTIVGSFYHQTGITEVIFLAPSNITTIYDNALAHTSLTSVTIPSSVTTIGGAFYGCTGLTNITVDAANPNYTAQGRILYDKAMTQLVALDFPRKSGQR